MMIKKQDIIPDIQFALMLKSEEFLAVSTTLPVVDPQPDEDEQEGDSIIWDVGW